MNAIEIIVPPTSCGACTFTKKALDRVGIPYRVTSAQDLPTSELDELRCQHHRSFPVLRTPVGTYSGALTPSAARELAARIERAEQAA